MTRSLAIVILAAAACSSRRPSPPAAVDVALVIAPEVTSVMRATGREFPIAAHATSLFRGEAPACWTGLVDAVASGW